MNNKIFLTGQFRLIELPLGATTINPGHLIEEYANGTVGTVRPHSTAGGFAERLFAQEDALQGLETDTNYTTAGQMVSIVAVVPGGRVLALLKAGTHYTCGMKLISNGDGRLEQTTGSPSQIIAVVDVDIDLSAGGAVDTLSPVRVL